VSEVLHGWRRKTGVLTLVMACLFAGAWIRSLTIGEMVWISIHKANIHEFKSVNGGLYWKSELIHGATDSIQTRFGYDSTADGIDDFEEGTDSHKWDSCGFAAGDYSWTLSDRSGSTNGEVNYCRIPYWSITASLTLISLWLLFSKPRSAKKAETAQISSLSSMPSSLI
jgi:hypothetical protein